MPNLEALRSVALLSILAVGCGDAKGDSNRVTGGVSRPGTNTGTGFFVSDGTIYDANGIEFVIRGLNHTHWWGENAFEAIPHIASAGPNAVRTVFGDAMGAATASQKRDVVQAYVDHGIVPVVEHHGATCETDGASLQSVVDVWLEPDNTAWLKEFERTVILNIANEWGPETIVWRDEYVTAVARLRAAGVKNLLLIDAGQCGQVAETITSWGREIFESDPERNVAFSVHMYTYWVDPGDPSVATWTALQPYDTDAQLGALVATGLPVVVGEFSWQASNSVPYTTRRAMQAYEAHHVGWLAWSWNQNSDPLLDMATGFQYRSTADLTEFGDLVVNDPEVGLKALATRATVFR